MTALTCGFRQKSAGGGGGAAVLEGASAAAAVEFSGTTMLKVVMLVVEMCVQRSSQQVCTVSGPPECECTVLRRLHCTALHCTRTALHSASWS